MTTELQTTGGIDLSKAIETELTPDLGTLGQNYEGRDEA